MAQPISTNHPLRQLFRVVVEQTFVSYLGVASPGVPEYVANVLVDFTHVDNIYRLRDARGCRLEEVAEMLVESDVRLNATSFEREREVHKHIGDFTLFWTGVYPEMLRYFRVATRADHLVDYVKRGRESYRIASTFSHAPYESEAPVLRTLAEEFETCMLGLHMVRRELDGLSDPQVRAVRKLLGEATFD